MRQFSCSLPVLVVTLSVAGCYDDDDECEDTVVTQISDDVDFTAIGTFAVLPEDAYQVPEDPEDYDDIDTHLRVANDAAIEQLELLGLTEVEPEEEPDVFLFNVAATQEGDGTIWSCVGGWVWWGWWGWYWDPCAWMAPMPVEYTVGTLVVGLADPVEEEVVFGGAVQGIVECSGDPVQRIEDGIVEIFEAYPDLE